MTQATHQTFDIMRVADRTRARERRALGAQWIVGTILSATGLVKRGWIGAVAGAAGATMLVNAAYNTERLRHRLTERKSWDTIDKASIESFPASDPPSSSRVD